MKNKTNLIKRIRNIIVGNTLPANEDLWLDTSEGEKKGVLKYKGNPIIGGGGSNSDYSSTKQTVTLFNDTIETQESSGGYLGLVENIDFDLVAGENYTVVFDGTSYDVKAISANDYIVLGELSDNNPSFDTYPFFINIYCSDDTKELELITTIEGSHTVEIKHEEDVITTTPEFKSAVDSVTGYSIGEEYETLYDDAVETEHVNGAFSTIITPAITLIEGDTYKVTFNGIEYTCKCYDNDGNLDIGAPYIEEEVPYDWSTYPFNIETYNSLIVGREETGLVTNQEGSCTLKIEHLTTSTKTTPEFVSMIQGIAGNSGSNSDNIVVYPDSVLFMDGLHSTYNNPPEQGKIYFIPFMDNGSTDGEYLYPVHIDELTNNDGTFSGYATMIGNPIILDNETLTAQPFNRTINPASGTTKGLCISYNASNNHYRLYYGDMELT